MEFGQRIKAARVQRKLTQDQVADKFFVTRQTISNWEKEKSYPDIASLIKISDYYHISLDTLLKEDTGMREYLEKTEIKRALNPIYLSLFVINIIFVILMFADLLGYIKIGIVGFFVLCLAMINVFALLKLQKFNKSNSLGLMKK